MSITATVENDAVKLPEELHIPDGTQVRVELLTPSQQAENVEEWLVWAVGASETGVTTDEVLKMNRGEP